MLLSKEKLEQKKRYIDAKYFENLAEHIDSYLEPTVAPLSRIQYLVAAHFFLSARKIRNKNYVYTFIFSI